MKQKLIAIGPRLIKPDYLIREYCATEGAPIVGPRYYASEIIAYAKVRVWPTWTEPCIDYVPVCIDQGAIHIVRSSYGTEDAGYILTNAVYMRGNMYKDAYVNDAFFKDILDCELDPDDAGFMIENLTDPENTVV